MLRNFAAALLATTLIAGPAFAVEPSGNASSPAPAATVRTDAKATVKAAAPSVEPAKHLRKHVRSHSRDHGRARCGLPRGGPRPSRSCA